MKNRSLLIKNARILTDEGLKEGSLYCRDGRIVTLGGENPPADESLDAKGSILAPGILDLHSHGAVNTDVNEGSTEGLLNICRFFAKKGVTGWLCSILTDTEEQTLKCIAAALEAMEQPDGENLMGIHLEGPFLSEKYAGAMPRQLLRSGDAALIRRYQQAAGGKILTMTLAPEVPGVMEAIPELSQMLTLCMGHSDADYAQAKAAIKAGVRCVTHTFNAMRLFHQHEPAIMGAALESDVYCEAICDGLHLHPGTVSMLTKLKGTERVIPVTDSIMATGLPDGDYMLGVNHIVVKDGDARLRDKDVRAGSTLTADRALKNLMSFTGLPLEAVLPMMSENPARLLSLGDRGRIAPGCRADFNLLDDEGNILATYILANKI